MSKRIRTLILSGVALVVLIGALCAVLLAPAPETEEGNGTTATTTTVPTLPALLDKTAADKTHTVKTVTVTHGDETYTVEANADGLMCVTAYADLPRYADKIDTLLKALTKITPVSLVKENATADEIAAFGFDKPQAAVSVTYEDGSTYAFEIGVADYGAKTDSYFREANGTTVYLIASSFVSQMTQPATAYIGRTMITAPTPREDDKTGKAQLMQLTLSGRAHAVPVTLRYKTAADEDKLAMLSPYIITAPYFRASDEQITASWQTGLNTMSASGVVKVHPTTEDLKTYGLDDPATVAGFTLAVYNEDKESGEVTTYDPVYYEVSVGNKTDGGDYYVMVKGTNIVYTVTTSYLPWLGYTYDTLTTKFLFLEYIVELSEIRLTLDGASHTLALTHGKDDKGSATMDVLLDGTTAMDSAATRTLYQTWMGVYRLASAEGVTPSGEPLFAMSFTRAEEGGPSVDFAIYAHSANRCLVWQADGDTYLVKASDVETMLQATRTYLAG